MSAEYNPVATRLSIEEMKNITGQKEVEIAGLDNKAVLFQTETGEFANRVFLVATLLELEDKGKDEPFYVGKVADPTGAIQINAGPYQPEAAAALASIDASVPQRIAIIGKLSAYKPEDGKTYMSIRAEKVHVVDASVQETYLGELKELLSERIDGNELAQEVVEKYVTKILPAL
jgi:hypothetical protein